MIRIKKWILISVFAIILVLTTDTVFAKEYNSLDSVSVSSQYHDIFNNYFGESKKFTYFPYLCYSNRTCYFGIDEDGNYLDITFNQIGNTYSLIYKKGVDHDFVVNGTNIFVHYPSMNTILTYSFIFIFLIILILNLV